MQNRFSRESPFYLATGPYDYNALRYYFLEGEPGRLRPSGGSPGKKPAGNQAADTEEPVDSVPLENQEEETQVTVKILAENGKDPAPKSLVPGLPAKLKGVPSKGGGTYAWKTKSAAASLAQAAEQVVSVSPVAGKAGSGSSVEVELVFTPSGKPPLAPIKHSLNLVKALFMKNDGHAWGYDEAGQISAKDHNWKAFQFNPDSTLDILSVPSGKSGVVDLYYEGVEGKEIFFAPVDASACACKPRDAGANPIALEIEGKAARYKETRIQARYGSAGGPVLAEIDLVVLAPAAYKAKYFRVEDPDSPGTKLKVAAGVADFQNALKRIYKGGVAEWRLEGEPGAVQSKYDIIRNGSLDIEPGADSEELKRLKADCVFNGTRIIHVHQLRWSYYLAADAGPKDTRIKLKAYGGYLDFVGTNAYTLEDSSGKSVTVKIKSADRAKAEFELEAPLGVELKTAQHAALIWPLGGLSGNPTLVSDFGGLATLIGIVAHELGHSNAGLKDTSEIKNIMHGVAEGNEGLRGRPIPLFYHPDQTEKQWAQMPGRS